MLLKGWDVKGSLVTQKSSRNKRAAMEEAAVCPQLGRRSRKEANREETHTFCTHRVAVRGPGGLRQGADSQRGDERPRQSARPGIRTGGSALCRRGWTRRERTLPGAAWSDILLWSDRRRPTSLERKSGDRGERASVDGPTSHRKDARLSSAGTGRHFLSWTRRYVRLDRLGG